MEEGIATVDDDEDLDVIDDYIEEQEENYLLNEERHGKRNDLQV